MGAVMSYARYILAVAVLTVMFRYLITFLKGMVLYLKRNRVYNKIGGPPKHWLWGHLKVYTHDGKGLLEHSKRMIKFPKMQAIWLGPFLGGISAYWPSVVGRVLSADTPKDYHLYRILKKWTGLALVTRRGPHYKRNRKLLAPAFHNDLIKKYMKIFNSATRNLVEHWKDKNVAEVHEGLSLLSFHVISHSATSTNMTLQNTADDMVFLRASKAVSDTLIERISHISYMFDFVFNRTKMSKILEKNLKVMNDRLEAIIEERTKEKESGKTSSKKKHLDFLETLLMARDASGAGLPKIEVRSELMGLFIGGFDTISNTSAWMLYHLAIHQEYQDKCRKEVTEVLEGKNELSWEDLQSLPFLTMCIKETLRMVPPVAFIGRELARPIKFERDFNADQYNPSTNPLPNAEETLPKGTRVEIKIYNIHHNPHLWDDPECYNPYRFAPENADKIKPFSFIPFSSGAKRCIGQNFAMAELKVILSMCLKNFKFTIDPDLPKPVLHPKIVLRSATGVHLKLERVK